MNSQGGTSLKLPELLGEDSRFLDALKRARKVAFLDVPVLLSGETGTGKGLLARWIHFFSPRREKSFVPINCGNFTAKESLLESELFGCEVGAFTDAKEKRKGIVEEASLGTLFLDEIDTLSLISQEKLLHFLEHQTFRRRSTLLRILSAVNLAIVQQQPTIGEKWKMSVIHYKAL